MGRDRFAAELLSWRWAGNQLQALIARCTYRVQAFGPEILAWAELADISGGRRCELGSFGSVSAAKAACELHAAALCRRDRSATGTNVSVGGPAVDVRISPGRRRSKSPPTTLIGRAPVGGRGARPPRPADHPGDIDDALAAIAWATEDEG
jgi:hypothetical protein